MQPETAHVTAGDCLGEAVLELSLTQYCTAGQTPALVLAAGAQRRQGLEWMCDTCVRIVAQLTDVLLLLYAIIV